MCWLRGISRRSYWCFTGSNQLAAIQYSAMFVSQNKYITVYTAVQQLNITLTAASVPGA